MITYEQAMAEAAKWHDANVAYDQIGCTILMGIFLVAFVWLVMDQLTAKDQDDDFPQGPKGA